MSNNTNASGGMKQKTVLALFLLTITTFVLGFFKFSNHGLEPKHESKNRAVKNSSESTTNSSQVSKKKVFGTIFFVTLLAFALRFFNFADLGMGNLFYAAAIRSMGESWHNFFYAAYDPLATIAVDKPPLALWLQVLTTKLFGFNAYGFIGPIALAGALATPLIFIGIYRWFGFGVATIAAVILAIFPESIATSRDSTMDTLLMFFSILSVLTLIAAVENRPRLLLLWGLSLAVLFNIKFFEGLIFLPAAAIYIIVRWRSCFIEKAGLLLATGFIFVVFSMLWLLTVEFTAADARPLIMNDPNNSPLSLAFFYNGIERIFPAEVTVFQPIPGAPQYSAALQTIWGPAFGVGDSGPFRLFSGANGPLMGFTLLFGILGTFSILIAKRSLLNGPALFWLIWFVTGLILFSFSNRAPAHYIESFAPAIAVMGGLGIARGAGYFGAIRVVVIPLTILLLVIYGLWITEEYPLLRTRLLYALAIGIVLYLCIYVSRFFTSSRFTIPILAIFLFFPLLTSMWIISFTPRAQITVPNPVLFAGENFNSRSNSDGQSWRRVPAEKFLSQLPNNSTSQYKFGIDGINNAGEAIAFTGQPILPVWNQYRREIMLPPDAMAKLFEDGDLPYLMLSEGRLATGLLEDLMAVTQEYCGYDQKLSRGFKGWVILKCDK